MRRGFTLVEMTVAMAIGTLTIVIAYNLIGLMTRSEYRIDTASQRAITESTMMQLMLMDIRSSTSLSKEGAEYRITRLVVPPGGGALTEIVVRWTEDPKEQKVTRTVSGEPPREFRFATPTNADRLSARLRIERTGDALFWQ